MQCTTILLIQMSSLIVLTDCSSLSHFCKTMSQDRERSINFTREEVGILVKLMEGNKQIIVNKKSDAVAFNQKEAASY